MSTSSGGATERARWWGTGLLKSTEGRILAAGLTVTVVCAVALVALFALEPEVAQIVVAMSATNIVFGRASGLSFGYAAGLGSGFVTLLNMVVETLLVLLVFPLFVFSWRHLQVVRPLRRFVDRTTALAERNRPRVERYGAIGLFAFVWFPFWLTGPVVGAALGHLLGLRPLANLAVVLSGTYLAIGCWSYFLGELHERVAAYSPFAPFILVIAMVGVALVAQWLYGQAKGNP